VVQTEKDHPQPTDPAAGELAHQTSIQVQWLRDRMLDRMLELEAPIVADLALTYQIPFRQNDILSTGLTT
jgi:hypothetical protein